MTDKAFKYLMREKELEREARDYDEWKPMKRVQREDSYSLFIRRASWIVGTLAAICIMTEFVWQIVLKVRG